MNNNVQPTTDKKKKKHKFFLWLKIIIIIYCSIGITLYYLQEKFLFHPQPLPYSYLYNFDFPFKEVNIPINKDENLNLVQFFPKDSLRKGVVLYFHGNMNNINTYAKFADNFTKKGYEVWMPDYPGYGKTTGELTEQKLYQEALQVYKLANNKYPTDSIIIYGKSLGTAIAAQLASVAACHRIILEAPYYSIPALFSSYAPIYPISRMSHFELPVYQYLQKIRVPITLFHGDNDEVIPYHSSKKLIEVLKPTDEFFTIQNGKHNNLATSTLYISKLDSLLNH